MAERLERLRTGTSRAGTLLRAIVTEVRAERVTFLAGSVAYHAFVSLLPLLLLLLAAVSTLGDASLEDAVLRLARAVLTPGASDVLLDELQRTSGSAGLSLFGLVVLVWGTLRIFRGLDTAFSDIYETEAENTFADQVADGIVVLLTFGLAATVAGVVLDAVPAGSSPGMRLVGAAALVVGLSVVLLPMYYVFPDTDVGLVEVLPGTLFAAVGLTAFQSLFGLYIAYSARQPARSVIAGVLVLLTWLYFSGLVLLVGASINAVLANRSADVTVRPLFGGVSVEQKADRSDRETVVRALGRLEDLLDPPRPLTVTVGKHSVQLPAPQRVHTDTGNSEFALGGGPAGVQFEWSLRGAARDAGGRDAAGDGDVAADVDLTEDPAAGADSAVAGTAGDSTETDDQSPGSDQG